jgi:hypothetical protein
MKQGVGMDEQEKKQLVNEEKLSLNTPSLRPRSTQNMPKLSVDYTDAATLVRQDRHCRAVFSIVAVGGPSATS